MYVCMYVPACIYVMIGHVTSGSLKTPAEADKESLQAKWLSADIKKLKLEVDLRLEIQKYIRVGMRAHCAHVFAKILSLFI